MASFEAKMEIDRLNEVVATLVKNSSSSYALNIPLPRPIDIQDGNIEENFFKIQ